MTITARTFGWAEKTFGYKWADPAKNPADAMGNAFAIEDALNKAGAARAKTTDGNSMIYTAKANQLYRLTDDEVKGMKAKILFVPAASDEIFPPELSKRAAERYKAQGGVAEVVVIEGDGGHLDGVFNVAKQGEAIRELPGSNRRARLRPCPQGLLAASPSRSAGRGLRVEGSQSLARRSRISTAGSVFPSRNSRNAPPPVEM